jgi:hypothetical protein
MQRIAHVWIHFGILLTNVLKPILVTTWFQCKDMCKIRMIGFCLSTGMQTDKYVEHTDLMGLQFCSGSASCRIKGGMDIHALPIFVAPADFVVFICFIGPACPLTWIPRRVFLVNFSDILMIYK